MRRGDLPRLTRALRRLCAVYGRSPSEELIEAYVAGLAGVPIEQVEQMAILWLQTEKRMPTPSDLRRDEQESPRNLAELAWAENRHQLPVACAGGIPDERATRILRQLGGWARIRSLDVEENDRWTRRNFIERYEADLIRERERIALESGTDALGLLGDGSSGAAPYKADEGNGHKD